LTGKRASPVECLLPYCAAIWSHMAKGGKGLLPLGRTAF
jgi:hypothetical protein